MGCVLIVDKNSLGIILGKEEVHELKATVGRTEIDLHWRNPSAVDAEKIVIWYAPARQNLNNKIEVTNIQPNEPTSQKITGLLPNTRTHLKWLSCIQTARQAAASLLGQKQQTRTGAGLSIHAARYALLRTFYRQRVCRSLL